MKVDAITTQKVLNSKIVKRTALPAASGLAILAGQSMNGGQFPPPNLTEGPRTLWDKIKYSWEMATGKRCSDGQLTENAKDVLSDDSVQDTASEATGSILEKIADFFD